MSQFISFWNIPHLHGCPGPVLQDIVEVLAKNTLLHIRSACIYMIFYVRVLGQLLASVAGEKLSLCKREHIMLLFGGSQ